MTFYSRQNAEKLLQRNRFHAWLAGIVGAGALLVCIVCCCLTNTANETRMELTAYAASTFGGWIVIFEWTAVILPNRYTARHEQRILDGPVQTLSGVLELDPRNIRIRKSITINRVLLHSDGETQRLSVRADCAKALPDGKPCRLQVVEGYIAAVEEVL